MINDQRYDELISLRDEHFLLTPIASNIDLQAALADHRFADWKSHTIADNWCQAYDEIRDIRYYSFSWRTLLKLISRAANIDHLYDSEAVLYESKSRDRIESFGFRTNTLCECASAS